MFFKIIANFTGNHLCQSLLWQSCRPQKCKLIKKRLQHRLFPVKIAEILRSPCFTEHLQRLLLKVSGFQPTTLLKERPRKRCFLRILQNFWEHLFFWQNTSGWLLPVFICGFWDFFKSTCFIEYLGETAILCTSCRISTTRYSKVLFKHFI